MTKPLASLSPTLLARKGAARPAMRPQGLAGFGLPQAEPQDDLGWNDVGDLSMTDAPDVPPVLAQREMLQKEFEETFAASDAVPERIAPASVMLSPARVARIARDTKAGPTKAAFTLRLDHERHLHLRLASALTDRSAQQLVIEALDAFLKTLPEVAVLANQLPPPGVR